MILRLLLSSTLFGLILATDSPFQLVAAPIPSAKCSTPDSSRYNGIRVEVPRGQTWQQLAAQYNVRADVLFELNGCQNVPQSVFIPGVNGSSQPISKQPIKGYPLPQKANIALGYGWQVDPLTSKVIFHSGIDLLAPLGTSVQAAYDGAIAFAGDQASYGNLVVINHPSGKQTRYAHLQSLAVRVGQIVNQGDVIGKVGITGKPSSKQAHLHFELRYASGIGWTAEDPALISR